MVDTCLSRGMKEDQKKDQIQSKGEREAWAYRPFVHMNGRTERRDGWMDEREEVNICRELGYEKSNNRRGKKQNEAGKTNLPCP